MARTYYFWDPLSDNILQERDETGAVTAEYTAEPGLYGNLISQNRGGVESQYHFDAQGSTLALTSDSQQVTDTYSYSAHGEVTESTGSTVNPFQYLGQKQYYRDNATAHYLIRRRPYGPTRARWLTVDPRKLIDGPNLYRYVHNRPTISVDPSGMLTIKWLKDNIPGVGCGDTAFIEWDFIIDNPKGAPCDGYFVMQNDVYCFSASCLKCWPMHPPLKPSFSFWEAWFVKSGDTMDIDRSEDPAYTYTDRAQAPLPEKTCGHVVRSGLLKFFCKNSAAGDEITGDLGRSGKNPTDPKSPWRIEQTYGMDTNCPASPGELPSVGSKPKWWDDKHVKEEKHATRYITSRWCCCPNQGRIVQVDGSPRK